MWQISAYIWGNQKVEVVGLTTPVTRPSMLAESEHLVFTVDRNEWTIYSQILNKMPDHFPNRCWGITNKQSATKEQSKGEQSATKEQRSCFAL